jgi:hypothetical protein
MCVCAPHEFDGQTELPTCESIAFSIFFFFLRIVCIQTSQVQKVSQNSHELFQNQWTGDIEDSDAEGNKNLMFFTLKCI